MTFVKNCKVVVTDFGTEIANVNTPLSQNAKDAKLLRSERVNEGGTEQLPFFGKINV